MSVADSLRGDRVRGKGSRVERRYRSFDRFDPACELSTTLPFRFPFLFSRSDRYNDRIRFSFEGSCYQDEGKLTTDFPRNGAQSSIRLAAYYVCRNQSRNGLSNSEIPSGL